MSEIPPVALPQQPSSQDTRLKRDDKRRQNRPGQPKPGKRPPPEDPNHIDEYA